MSEFLNNASVGAAVGAILAFVLFLATQPTMDFFRQKRIHTRFIPNLLAINAHLCLKKIEMAERLLAGSEGTPPTFSPGMVNRFDVETLRKLEC
jgi:hypothetical protein